MTDDTNANPAVMFEIIAKDQDRMKRFYSAVFGWDYDAGADGFAYVHFGLRDTPLLGGIGKSNPRVPGLEPGHSFYFRVDDIEAILTRIVEAGGTRHMEETEVDGYTFAMGKDPEGNTFGLVKPFDR